MPDKAEFVSSVYCPGAVTGETSIVSSPALRQLLLAENEFAPSISPSKQLSLHLCPSDLCSKHILLVIEKESTPEGLGCCY